MYVLNNVQTADEYTSGNTLECPGTTELNILIANAAVYLQFAFRNVGYTSAAPVWAPEVFYPPGEKTRGRNVEQVRVRSAVSKKPAQVTIEAVS